MNATQLAPRRTSAPRRLKAGRPVQSTLLELTYLLHANRVVKPVGHGSKK